MVRIGVRRIRRQAGKVYILFTDKVGLEFASMADFRDWADAGDLDGPEVRDILRRILVRWAVLQDATVQPASIEGKQITLDLSSLTNKLEIV